MATITTPQIEQKVYTQLRFLGFNSFNPPGSLSPNDNGSLSSIWAICRETEKDTFEIAPGGEFRVDASNINEILEVYPQLASLLGVIEGALKPFAVQKSNLLFPDE